MRQKNKKGESIAKSVFGLWAQVLLLIKKIRKSRIFVSKKSENKSRHNK
jgi:hypothetical protein